MKEEINEKANDVSGLESHPRTIGSKEEGEPPNKNNPLR